MNVLLHALEMLPYSDRPDVDGITRFALECRLKNLPFVHPEIVLTRYTSGRHIKKRVAYFYWRKLQAFCRRHKIGLTVGVDLQGWGRSSLWPGDRDKVQAMIAEAKAWEAA